LKIERVLKINLFLNEYEFFAKNSLKTLKESLAYRVPVCIVCGAKGRGGRGGRAGVGGPHPPTVDGGESHSFPEPGSTKAISRISQFSRQSW
jgi:hypothetical protein